VIFMSAKRGMRRNYFGGGGGAVASFLADEIYANP